MLLSSAVFRLRSFVCLFALLVASLALASHATAETFTWSGDGDGISWSDPDNWDDPVNDPGVPGIGDIAIIGGSVELYGDAAVGTLDITGSLLVDSGATLTVTTLLLDGASITGAGTLVNDGSADSQSGTISLSFQLTGTQFQCSNRLTIGENGTMEIQGTLSGQCIVDMDDGSVLINTGTIERGVSIAAPFDPYTTYPVVENRSGATFSGSSFAAMENEGTVLAASGTLDLQGGGTSGGTFRVEEGASLRLSEESGPVSWDLTGATFEGAGSLTFRRLQSPLTLTDVNYNLDATTSGTTIREAQVTFPSSMTFGSLGATVNVYSDDATSDEAILVEHDVAVASLNIRSGTFGGGGALTVSDQFRVDGTLSGRDVTIAPTVANGTSIAPMSLTNGTTVINEGSVDLQRLNMGDGTQWTNRGNLTVDASSVSEGLRASGPGTTAPAFINEGTVQIEFGDLTVGVPVTNGGLFNHRGRMTLTRAFTNTATGTLSGTGTIDATSAPAIQNDGTIAPGRTDFPFAQFPIEGDLVMGSTSVLELGLSGPESREDLLDIEGTIQLDGTLDVTLVDMPLGTYDLVAPTISGSLSRTGTFSQVNITTGYTASETYASDRVTLTISETPYPLLDPSPLDIDFADAEVGDVDAISIENTGSGTLELSSATLAGNDPGRFEIAQPSFPVQLANGESVDITVRVAGPAVSSAVSADLQVAHNGDADGSATASFPITADQIVDPNFGEAAGYFWANSTVFADDAPSQPVFDWVDISATGTDRIGDLSDDSVIGPLSLGFSFQFFGQDYTEFWLSSNGWISFTNPAGESESSNERIPDTDAPNNLIAWFWSDMDPTDADVTGRHVYTQPTTVNGRSAFVITFERLPEYSADADGWITGQLILLAGADASTNGAIKLQYEEHGTSIDLETATVGIENASGTGGLQYRYDRTGGPLFGSPLAVQIGPDASTLPVELAGFDATVDGDAVELVWQTVTETGNDGFYVERRIPGKAYDDIRFVEGAGTTTQTTRYAMRDATAPVDADTLEYRLRQVDVDGEESVSEPRRVVRSVGPAPTLTAPSPNPSRGTVELPYALPTSGAVRIDVYNVLGQRVATLVDDEKTAGRHRVQFSAHDWSSGVYFVRMTTDVQTLTQRLTIVR